MKNLTASEFSELLRSHHACSEASEWAKGKDLAEVWHTCHRGDWMLWLLGRMTDRPGWLTRKEVCAIVCDVVEPSLRYVRPGEMRPQACLDTVRGWIAGTHTLEQVRKARRAADAYAYADAAAAAAAYSTTRTRSLLQSANICRRQVSIDCSGSAVGA
ncbi:MAG TPA: hypothetical protein VII58_12630 [Acidobacteriaceae bacterium]